MKPIVLLFRFTPLPKTVTITVDLRRAAEAERNLRANGAWSIPPTDGRDRTNDSTGSVR